MALKIQLAKLELHGFAEAPQSLGFGSNAAATSRPKRRAQDPRPKPQRATD